MPEKLTAEQAEWLKERVWQLATGHALPATDRAAAVLRTLAVVEQAIRELTAGPGEEEYCYPKDCPAWYSTTEETDDGTTVYFPARCHHLDYRPGYCPREASCKS